MKLFTRVAPLLLLIFIAGQRKLNAQSILDPTDPIINYNSSSPPVQPPWGQIGKWIRTPRMSWNTSAWKCYIYKNYAFRLKFPKTYNPAANDGKKYPLLLFFHGYGEIAPNTDNEFHMLWGHQFFQSQVDNGNFDGYVLSMQSVGFFGVNHYAALVEIIQYMIANNKLDPFQIATNGLSAGGQGSWDMMINYPAYAHAALPMSWCSLLYTDPATLPKIKYSPIWHFQGGLDGNPAPYTTNYVQNIINGVGGNMKNTLYPNDPHNTWVDAWNEPDFIPFINRAYASNPWPLYGKTDYYLGEPINQTLGVNPGFANYEWRKRGVLIPGANSNTLLVNDTGLYQCRVFLNGLWSEWSRTPCYIKLKPAPTLPNKIEAESFLAMSGVQIENTLDVGGGQNVGYIENGDWMDYGVVPPVNGTYLLKIRIASPNNGGQLQVRKSDGTVLSTVSVPNTGGWQSWQTITTTFSLPAAYNGLRIISTATPGWNINWIEISQIASAPTANAGADQTIHLPTNSIQLNGSGTDTDGTITGYNWSKIAGPATFTITGGTTATPTMSNLVNGSYTFRLTVTDNGGNIGTDDVVVIVNQKPAANAGTDQTIHLPTNSIQLNGGGTDADGTISTYGWSKISGPAGSTFSNASVANPTVNGLAAGVHTFRLTVTDNNGGTATDDVIITVNQVPVVNAGTDISIDLPTNSTPLNGSASDPDAGGSISTYSWSKVSGPSQFTLSSNSIADPILSNLVIGVYTFRLTATDNSGGISSDDVVITVNTEPGVPTSNAGTDQTIHLPTNSIQLNGSGTDEDGTIDSYDWIKVSGPTFTIDDATLPNPTLSNLLAGIYTFRLTVTDNDGKTSTDDVVITVNTLPDVNAGTDQTIHLPTNTANLSGSATDADAGSTITYNWTKFSGPSTFTISNANIANPTLSNLVAGTYTFRLTATDNNGGAVTDDVVIIVNTPPTANAGTDVTLTLPINSTPLNGSGSDPDAGGSISTYSWSKISGPATFTISDANIANPSLTNLVQGSYTFRLTVTDNRGATATDDVIINVVPAIVRIQAENWSSMLGVQTETTTDVGGGLSVGFINLNDWMEYTINATQAGVHTLWFRIATPYTGQTLQVKNSGGTVLATVNIPQTAGWQTWSTTATQITLPAGTQTIRIQSTSTSGWNFNWMELMFGIPPSGKIEAEMYTNMSGIQTETTTDVGGGLNVGYVDNNDWMEYSVTTNAAGNYNINFRLAARTAAGQLQIRKPDGTVLATLATPLTGGWQTWQTVTATNVPLAAGTQTIRIVCTAPANWNFNWLEIVQPVGGAANVFDVMPGSARRGNVSNEQQDEVFETYPNPVQNRMVVKLDNTYSGNMNVQFINSNGAVQKQLTLTKPKGLSQHTLSLADLPKGEYVMVIDMNGNRTTKKITKL